MAFSWTTHVDAPPKRVFDILAEMPQHGEWADPKAKLKVHEVSGGSPALGSKYRSDQMFFAKPTTADLEIVAFDRPGKFAYSVSQRAEGKKDVHLTHTFALTPSGGGTDVRRVTDGDGNPLMGLIFYPAIKGDGTKALKRLKARAEGASRS